MFDHFTLFNLGNVVNYLPSDLVENSMSSSLLQPYFVQDNNFPTQYAYHGFRV